MSRGAIIARYPEVCPHGKGWTCWRRDGCTLSTCEGRRSQHREARTVPMPVFAQHAKHWCRWCGGEISHGRVAQRSWHDGREDEPNCIGEYRLHTRRDDQFAFVEARDGLRCWDCGASPERWRRGSEVAISGPWRDRHDERIEWVGRYCEVDQVTALELEHEAPLWSVAHLSADERRPFYGPTNLRLRCPRCHKAKTAREAAARAGVAA